MPLNPTDIYGSPYTPVSSFAIDDIYVSLTDLKKRGLIGEITPYMNKSKRVNYAKVRKYKEAYFNLAYDNFVKFNQSTAVLDEFKKKHNNIEPRVIIFRENETKNSNMTLFTDEVKSINSYFRSINSKSSFTYILLNKKHNLKIVTSRGNGQYCNIESGTLVDNTIIGNAFEFYLVSQKSGQGIFNGDIGYIHKINRQNGEITIWFEDGRECIYPRTEIYQLSLAFINANFIFLYRFIKC